MGRKEIIYDIKGFEDPINGYVEDLSYNAERANSTEENRYTYIGNCAAVSRGKDESSNPKARYAHLLKEAALNSSSRLSKYINKEWL